MALKVGIVRDERYLEHKTGHMHPEHPNRLKAVYGMLDTDFPSGLIHVKPEPATLEHLELVHTPSYIDKVLKTADHKLTNLDPDTQRFGGIDLRSMPCLLSLGKASRASRPAGSGWGILYLQQSRHYSPLCHESTWISTYPDSGLGYSPGKRRL